MASSSGNPVSASEIIDSYITSNKVMIFSKSYCPYCLDAKDLLKELNEPFHVVELDELTNGYALQDELLALTGQYTVPNIFINGQHIGGYDDLSASLATGQLVKILGK